MPLQSNAKSACSPELGTEAFNILICDDQEPIVEMCRDLLVEIVPAGTALNMLTAMTEVEVLLSAESRRIDLFIFVLNNIIFRTERFGPLPRPQQALAFLSYLKATYNVPVVGLYAYPDDDSYAVEATLAGADRAMKIPCPVKRIGEAFEYCLHHSRLSP